MEQEKKCSILSIKKIKNKINESYYVKQQRDLSRRKPQWGDERETFVKKSEVLNGKGRENEVRWGRENAMFQWKEKDSKLF